MLYVLVYCIVKHTAKRGAFLLQLFRGELRADECSETKIKKLFKYFKKFRALATTRFCHEYEKTETLFGITKFHFHFKIADGILRPFVVSGLKAGINCNHLKKSIPKSMEPFHT